MVRLRLFGSAELVSGDGTVIHSVLSQPRRLALLAYLAVGVKRGFVRRDLLLALFWPEKDDEHARNALRQSLHFLRRSLGQGVIDARGDDEVGVDHEALWVDVLEFEGLLERGDPRAALELCRGRFLDGRHVSGMPDLERWAESERSRLEHLAWEAATEVARDAERAGDPSTALTFARQALDRAPGNDVALRLVMTALQRSGDRQGALDAYDQFARFVEDDLDLAPEAETVALAEAIRSGELPRAPRPEATLAPVAIHPASTLQVPTPGPRRPGLRSWRAAVAVLGLVGLAAAAWGASQGPAPDPAGRDGRLIITDFVDETNEGLGPVVSGALRIDFQRSGLLSPVEASEVMRVLRLMDVDPGEPLTPETGRTLARREGIPAVVDGAVARAGQGYMLSATLREAESGRVLVSARTDAAGPEGIIDAIDRLSKEIRRRAGESLRTLQAGRPLAQVTTHSLDALRFYAQGVVAFEELNDRPRSARLLEQAVALDSTFAMAWRQLSVALQGGVDPTRRQEAVERAYRYRERLSPVERLLVEAHYHQLRGPPGAAREAYERLLAIDPHNAAALNNLGLIHRMLDHLDQAAAYLGRAVAGPGGSSSAYNNLLDTELSRNRGDEAAAVLRALEAAYPEFELTGHRRFWVAFTRGDTAGASSLAHEMADDEMRPAEERATGLTLLAYLAYWTGRLDEGRSLMVRADTLARRNGAAAAWRHRILAGFTEALMGDTAWARAWTREGMTGLLALPPHQRHHRDVAMTLAYAGDPASARNVLLDWLDVVTVDPNPSAPADLGRTTVYVRAEAGDAWEGNDPLQDLPTETVCEDACWVYHRARYHDGRGEIREAIAAYERVRVGGYTNWGRNIAQRLHAMERLGPLYEAAGDTARAVEAYRRLADQWAHADSRGQAVVRRFRERITALGG